MAIRKMTYLDIPKEVRRKRAYAAQSQLQGILSHRGTSEEQKEYARKQLGVVKKWSAGELPTQLDGPNEPEV